MNGYEMVVPYLIADRQARADADRLARTVITRSKDKDADDVDGGSRDVASEPWVPVMLRGYPYDPEFGR